MLVSSNVEASSATAAAWSARGACQLLALEPGSRRPSSTAPSGRTFRIELLKIHLVATDKLHRAPLGAPRAEPHMSS